MYEKTFSLDLVKLNLILGSEELQLLHYVH